MRKTFVAWAVRLLGRTAAVALAALFLGALAAAPAGATTRDQARDKANDFIASCFAAGGDPYVVEASDGRIFVTCYNGSDTVSCEFYPTTYCFDQDGPASSRDVPAREITAHPVSAADSLQPESPAWRAPTGDIPDLAEDASLTEGSANLTETDAAAAGEIVSSEAAAPVTEVADESVGAEEPIDAQP